MSIIAGVDPGSRVAGLCVLNTDRSRRDQVLEMRSVALIGRTPEDRLEKFGACLEAWIEHWNPRIVAVEDGYVGDNAKTALMIGEFRGVAFFMCGRRSAVVHRIGASTARKVLAVKQTHRAHIKQEVRIAVANYFGLSMAPPEDAADAAVLALWAAHMVNVPTPFGSNRVQSSKTPF